MIVAHFSQRKENQHRKNHDAEINKHRQQKRMLAQIVKHSNGNTANGSTDQSVAKRDFYQRVLKHPRKKNILKIESKLTTTNLKLVT